jgi:hypothetical protein
MHRSYKRTRCSTLAPVVARSRLAAVDPIGAYDVNEALAGHLVSERGYASALRAYTRYCFLREEPAFPADEIFVAGYIIHMCSSISVSSLKVYLAAIKHFQELEGHNWDLRGNEMVRRALRFVKRRHPRPTIALKFPLSTQVLRSIFPCMPGWPNWSFMSHDDRVIIAATTIAVCAFLRGGEFLVYPGSQRPMLLHGDITVHKVRQLPAVRVDIAQPKNMWWVQSASVSCFDAGAGDDFGPLKALRVYRNLSTVPLEDDGPAFKLANGRPLSKKIWAKRITELLDSAKLVIVGFDGTKAMVKAASCRAGGVRSAMDAGISQPLIMAMGRWRSLAWDNYVLHNASDLQSSMEAMWRERAPAKATIFVGEPTSANSILPSDDNLEEEVRDLLTNRSANRSARDSEYSPLPISRSRCCG